MTMHSTASCTPRSPRAFKTRLVLPISLIVIGGLYLDAMAEPRIADLFVAFHVASLTGAASAVWPFLSATRESRSRVLALTAGFILWRIAYFPVFVISGWVATWFDWSSYAAQLPVTGIYFVFLPAIFALHFVITLVTMLVVMRRKWLLLIPGFPMLVLAMLVSFNQPVDLNLLPDRTISREPRFSSQPLPQGNVYGLLLEGGKSNPAQYALLYSGLILYELIPSAPWSSTVKQVIAQGALENPNGSTADRVYEHYVAFLFAQPCVRRTEKCLAMYSAVTEGGGQSIDAVVPRPSDRF